MMMHLSTIRHKRRHFPHRQQGAGLILLIFIIVVVVGLLALVVNRNQVRGSDQLIASVIGTRAELAARSAAQIELSRFYRQDTGSCYHGEQSIDFEGDGLSQCEATVTCREIGELDSGISVHQLTAVGQCTVGNWTLQRVIEVGLRDD